MIEVLYIFNKNNPKIYNLKVDYFDDFKYLMNIKTLEDIKENYNINQILSVLIMKNNNNLLFDYLKTILNNNKKILKQNHVLLNYIVKHEYMNIIELLFEKEVSNNDKILLYIGRYGS